MKKIQQKLVRTLEKSPDVFYSGGGEVGKCAV